MHTTPTSAPAGTSRIVGARTPMRRQLLDRVDAIVEREVEARAGELRGWHLDAVLTDARLGDHRGHVVALRARRNGPGAHLAPPWEVIRAVALRVVALEWSVATVVPDVATAPPVVEAPQHDDIITIDGCTLDLRDIGIDVLSA